MRLRGTVSKDGRFWLAEVPILDAMTQGRTRREAFEMIADWIETMADSPGFSVTVHGGSSDEFEISSNNTKAMVCLLLQRQRHMSGLSLAEAAARLGVRSRNAYARYEHGTSVPTVEKLNQLLQAVCKDRDFVIAESRLR